MNKQAKDVGIHLTVLAAFLAAYGVDYLAAPSFGLAVIGTIVFVYGLFSGEI